MPSLWSCLSCLPRFTSPNLSSTPLQTNIFQVSKINFHTQNLKKLWFLSRARDLAYSKRYVTTHAETQSIRIVIPDGKRDFESSKIIEVKDKGGSTQKMPLDAVVKVFFYYWIPNKRYPWVGEHVWNQQRSGLIIPGKRVLTKACCLERHTPVQLKKHDSDRKYTAVVLDVGTECDLALLTVKDDEFWEGVPDVEFEEWPELNHYVTVAGYYDKQNTISLSKGYIMTLAARAKHHSTVIPPILVNCNKESGGKLGGPVFNQLGKCVGILVQSTKFGTEVIPSWVVSHFIRDYEKNGKDTGIAWFPNLGLRWLNLQHSSLRKSLGMSQNQYGVIIYDIEPTSPESQILKQSDVLLSFDGVKIMNNGKVPLANAQYVDFSYIVAQKYNGDTARIEIIRDKKKVELDIKLANHTRNILSNFKKEAHPYYEIAGFLFTPASVEYLKTRFNYCDGSSKHPIEMLKYLSKWIQYPEERPVVLSKVILAEINSGYEAADYEGSEVVSLNGEAVKNLDSMIAMINRCKDQYLKFQLEDGKEFCLETENAKASTINSFWKQIMPTGQQMPLKPLFPSE